jgi:hypothetical protein
VPVDYDRWRTGIALSLSLFECFDSNNLDISCYAFLIEYFSKSLEGFVM